MYYTRSRKVGGRVVREYVGAGRIGALAQVRHENGERSTNPSGCPLFIGVRIERAAVVGEPMAERVALTTPDAILCDQGIC